MTGRLGTTTSRILWLFHFIVCAFLTVLVSVQAYRAFMSKYWPVTNGVVIAFYETPQYRYSAGGGSHVNDQVSCNEFFNRLLATKNSEKYAVRYPLDAKVTVHYHPGKPELSVLETKFDPSILWVVGVFLLLSLLCATVAGSWRGRNKVFPQPQNESAENSEESLF